MIFSVVTYLGHGVAEHPLGPLYLGRYLGQVRYLEGCPVLLDDIHHVDVVHVEDAVFYTEFVLREVKGLADQVDVFVLH